MENNTSNNTQQAFQSSSPLAHETRATQERNSIDEIQKLIKNIRAACEKNRTHYLKIIKQNPFFSHQLYNPPVHLNIKKSEINVTKNLLIKQLDNLLEEQNKFLRELSKIQIREEQQKFYKQSHLDKQMNHFLFLRSVWKRSTIALDSQDKVQKLSKSVALIKGHITSLTKRQNTESISNQVQLQKQFIVNSWQYTQLKQKYQKLAMETEQARQIKQVRESESANKQQLNKLQHQNQKLRIQITEQKQKIKNLQKVKLVHIMKIQELEQQIFKKERDLHKFNKEIKLVYKNESQDFQVQILCKTLIGREQKKTQKTLQEVIAGIEGLKLNIEIKSQLRGQQENNQRNIDVVKNRKLTLTDRVGPFNDKNTRNLNLSPNSKPLIGIKYQKDSCQRKIMSNCIGQSGLNTKRMRSISDKNSNFESDVKKARFVRTGTKNSLDESLKEQNKDSQILENLNRKSIGQKIKFENQTKKKHEYGITDF